MKKLLIVLCGLVFTTSALADSITLKFRDFTKKEMKQIEAERQEGADSDVFPTNNGLWYVYPEEEAASEVFRKAANSNKCVKLTGSKQQIKGKYIGPEFTSSQAKAQIVKCP